MDILTVKLYTYISGSWQGVANCAHLFDQQTGSFHYGELLEFLLGTTAQAFWDLDQDEKLPNGIEIGIHNRNFKPCSDCLNERETGNTHNPFTHCQKCIPVVTHTKQGVCVLLKGHGRVLIMDLIPVLPSPQEDSQPLMEMYSLITTSLLEEKPPGWKKAFMAYFTKDKVLAEEMHKLLEESQEQTDRRRYILVKILNYGHEPNFQIRATQSIDAIAKLTSEHGDCLSYQYAKALTKLLDIQDVNSYLTKKAYLSPTNYNRSMVASHGEGQHERRGLLAIISSQELQRSFSKRIDFDNPEFGDKLTKEGIILLKTRPDFSNPKPIYFRSICGFFIFFLCIFLFIFFTRFIDYLELISLLSK